MNIVIEMLNRINNVYRKPITHPDMVLDLPRAMNVFDSAICAVELNFGGRIVVPGAMQKMRQLVDVIEAQVAAQQMAHAMQRRVGHIISET